MRKQQSVRRRRAHIYIYMCVWCVRMYVCVVYVCTYVHIKRGPRKYATITLRQINKAFPSGGRGIGKLMYSVPSRCCSALQFLPCPQDGFQERDTFQGKEIKKYQTPFLTTSSSLWQGLGCPQTQGHFQLVAEKDTGHFLCGLITLNCLPSCYVPFPSTVGKIYSGFLFEKSQSAVGWPSALGQNILSAECDVEAAVHLTWQYLRSRGEGWPPVTQLPLSRPCSCSSVTPL